MTDPLEGATFATDPDATPEETRAALATELTKQAAGCLWILRERGEIGGDLRQIIGDVLSLLDSALELETGQTEFTIEFTRDLQAEDPEAPRSVTFGNGKFIYNTWGPEEEG